MMNKGNNIALIREIKRKDAIYLAELLLKKNCFVRGLKRLACSYKTTRIYQLYQDQHIKYAKYIA